jgi:ribonuclease P/MRP protein subunit RPP1
MEDSSARRNFISNCISIVRATRGRGLVISSEAKNILGLRAPADVLNLLGVWGLARERGLESMGVNPRGVVINEGMKRTSFRGVVNVIDGGESQFIKEKKDIPTPTQQNGIGKKGKRKVEDAQPDSAPPPSKRAAKKAKLLAKQAQAGVQSQDTTTPSKTKAKANG